VRRDREAGRAYAQGREEQGDEEGKRIIVAMCRRLLCFFLTCHLAALARDHHRDRRARGRAKIPCFVYLIKRIREGAGEP